MREGAGLTTIQDSNVPVACVDRLKNLGSAEPFPVDIVTYIMANPISDEELAQVVAEADYTGGVRVGGVKFTLDGSPQGRTAWLSEPYHEGPPGQDGVQAIIDLVAFPPVRP